MPNRVNRVVIQLLAEEDGWNSWMKRLYSERHFGLYQTLCCADPAEKEGRRSAHGSRNFLQALLVRRLLWEWCRRRRSLGLSGRGTGEAERMFLGGRD